MISWPFDSTLTTDTEGNPMYSRTYSSDVLAKILRKYFCNGVFSDVSTSFQVVEAEGMTVAVEAGEALINGRHCYEEARRTLAVQAADASLDRMDTVVLRLDLSVSVLSIDLYILAGTPAASPTAPVLTRNSSTWELGLANLFISKGSTTVTQARITDTRLDSDRCGVVASVIGDTDTSAYYAQITADLAAFKAAEEAAFTAWSSATQNSMEAWITAEQATFDAWFASVQDALGEDAAGNLLNLINQYRAHASQETLPVTGWAASGDVYTQTLAVSIVPANCVLHASPAEANRTEYLDNDIHVSAAGEGSVTFTASGKPENDLTVNIAVSEVSA